MKTRSCLALLVVTTAPALLNSGCVSYANWPPVPDNIAINNPNDPATEEVMMAGLAWALNKFPPEGDKAPLTPPAPRKKGDPEPAARAAVNAPRGVTANVYRRLAEAAGGARGGVVPLTPATQNLPTYHVGWVRIRGDEAYMTVFRPVVAIGGSSTTGQVYQEIKLGLRGGLQPWRIVDVRPWEVGARPAPEANYYVPEPEVTPQRSPSSIDSDTTYKPGPRAIEAPAGTPSETPKPPSF